MCYLHLGVGEANGSPIKVAEVLGGASLTSGSRLLDLLFKNVTS